MDLLFLTLPQGGAKAVHYMFRELVLLYIYFYYYLSILLDINITDLTIFSPFQTTRIALPVQFNVVHPSAECVDAVAPHPSLVTI